MWWLFSNIALAGEVDLWRAEAALAAEDLYSAMGHLDHALSEDPADWRAHQLFRDALSELPWLQHAVYRGLLESGTPEERLLAQLALGEPLDPPVGVDPALLQLAWAQRHWELGEVPAALQALEGLNNPAAAEMRLGLLATFERPGALRREARSSLDAWPRQLQILRPLFEGRELGVLDRGLRSQVLSTAAELVAGDDPVGVYRAHALYLAMGERQLALAASARLVALSEPEKVAAHRPWSDSMARDVGRLLALQRTPHLPEGATGLEQAKALAWAAREKERKGQTEAAEALWEQLLTVDGVSPPLMLEALHHLERSGRSPQQLLLDAERLRVAAARDPLRAPDALLGEAWLLSARSHRRLSQLDQALVAADLAAALGAVPQALVLQGELLEQLGQPEAAFFAYAEAAASGAEGLDERLARVSPLPGDPERVVEAIPGAQRTESGPEQVARPAQSLAGTPIQLTGGEGTLAGGWTVVFFWASWCAPCHLELPEADLLAQAMADDPVRFVAVSVDAKEGDARRYLSKHPTPNLEQAWDPAFGEAADIQGLPTLLILSPEGDVVKRRQGYVTGEVTALEPELRALLNNGD